MERARKTARGPSGGGSAFRELDRARRAGAYLHAGPMSCRVLLMRTKVSKRGQVSVPADVRRELKIEPNTVLEWVVEGRTARVIPLPDDPVSAFRGSGRRGQVKALLRERNRDRRREARGSR